MIFDADQTFSMVPLLAIPDDTTTLVTAHTIYRKYGQLAQAMTMAIRLNDVDMIQQDFNATEDQALKKQLAFLIARQGIAIETDDEKIAECLNNSRLSEHFLALGKELNILDPKTPEDIYKSHLENTRGPGASVDNAKQNLANSFVNGFINAGFTSDKLMLTDEDSNSWVYKNKDAGMLSATASIGMIHQWNVDVGLGVIDRFTEAPEDYIKVRFLLRTVSSFPQSANHSYRRPEPPSLSELSTRVCGQTRIPQWHCCAIPSTSTAKFLRSRRWPSWVSAWHMPDRRRTTCGNGSNPSWLNLLRLLRAQLWQHCRLV